MKSCGRTVAYTLRTFCFTSQSTRTTSIEPPRLTYSYDARGPHLAVELRCGSHRAGIFGVVDSGADRTLLPLSIATELGLDPEIDLTPSPGVSTGAGDVRLQTWVTEREITGRIIAILDVDPEPWGPVITFAPCFAEGTEALLGRADFFKYFTIAFEKPADGERRYYIDES